MAAFDTGRTRTITQSWTLTINLDVPTWAASTSQIANIIGSWNTSFAIWDWKSPPFPPNPRPKTWIIGCPDGTDISGSLSGLTDPLSVTFTVEVELKEQAEFVEYPNALELVNHTKQMSLVYSEVPVSASWSCTGQASSSGTITLPLTYDYYKSECATHSELLLVSGTTWEIGSFTEETAALATGVELDWSDMPDRSSTPNGHYSCSTSGQTTTFFAHGDGTWNEEWVGGTVKWPFIYKGNYRSFKFDQEFDGMALEGGWESDALNPDAGFAYTKLSSEEADLVIVKRADWDPGYTWDGEVYFRIDEDWITANRAFWMDNYCTLDDDWLESPWEAMSIDLAATAVIDPLDGSSPSSWSDTDCTSTLSGNELSIACASSGAPKVTKTLVTDWFTNVTATGSTSYRFNKHGAGEDLTNWHNWRFLHLNLKGNSANLPFTVRVRYRVVTVDDNHLNDATRESTFLVHTSDEDITFSGIVGTSYQDFYFDLLSPESGPVEADLSFVYEVVLEDLQTSATYVVALVELDCETAELTDSQLELKCFIPWTEYNAITGKRSGCRLLDNLIEDSYQPKEKGVAYIEKLRSAAGLWLDTFRTPDALGEDIEGQEGFSVTMGSWPANVPEYASFLLDDMSNLTGSLLATCRIDTVQLYPAMVYSGEVYSMNIAKRIWGKFEGVVLAEGVHESPASMADHDVTLYEDYLSSQIEYGTTQSDEFGWYKSVPGRQNDYGDKEIDAHTKWGLTHENVPGAYPSLPTGDYYLRLDHGDYELAEYLLSGQYTHYSFWLESKKALSVAIDRDDAWFHVIAFVDENDYLSILTDFAYLLTSTKVVDGGLDVKIGPDGNLALVYSQEGVIYTTSVSAYTFGSDVEVADGKHPRLLKLPNSGAFLLGFLDGTTWKCCQASYDGGGALTVDATEYTIVTGAEDAGGDFEVAADGAILFVYVDGDGAIQTKSSKDYGETWS